MQLEPMEMISVRQELATKEIVTLDSKLLLYKLATKEIVTLDSKLLLYKIFLHKNQCSR